MESDSESLSNFSATSNATADPSVTWGKTRDEKVFKVPQTNDMLANLFSHFPPSPKTHNIFELTTLCLCAIQILTLAFYLKSGWLPENFRLYFLAVFLVFRMSYNAGLGWLLRNQSNDAAFTNWCRQSGFFDLDVASKIDTGKRAYAFLKSQLSLKMNPHDFAFDNVPIEFKSWLLFRELVDFILVNDFVAYLVFACSFADLPARNDFGWFDALRFIAGFALILFNGWVKMDAHRVVKDFAWYWGDFFFLIDKNLTFDGVFEMCFHPMYSVGYAGFYGVSIMANSYTVLFVSLLAHGAQFVFLYLVEEPHIKKIYGSGSSSSLRSDHRIYDILYGRDSQNAYFRRDLIVFKNFDWFRSSDLILAWSVFTTLALAFPFPSWLGISIPAWFLMGHAFLWRMFHSFALGWVLREQSLHKIVTKHFIKFGGSNRDAFANWKIVYNYSMTMTYCSFIAAALNSYVAPASWTEVITGPFLLRQVLGSLMILMHIWMSVSVFEVLEDFGWFYGDFYIDEFPAELHYTGIYRYLNNPEKILGLAAFWGFALVSGERWMFFLAAVSHLSNWLFLEYVETPHMQRLYGPKIRKESGLTKTLRKSLASPVKRSLEKQKVVADVNKVLSEVNKIGVDVVQIVESIVLNNVNDVKNEVEKVVDLAKPAIDELMLETRTIVAETTARLATIGSNVGANAATIADLEHVDVTEYSLQLSSSSFSPAISAFVSFALGEPISVYWTASADHSLKDWVGIYKITANPSKSVTTTSSVGRWKYVESAQDTAGQIIFDGDRLPWEIGVYECRYHLNDKYLVMASTAYFEIKVETQPILDDVLLTASLLPNSPDSLSSLPPTVYPVLPHEHPNSYSNIIVVILALYRRALCNPELSPSDHFIIDAKGEEKHARRIAYGIKLMYGIEFSWKTIAHFEPTAERMVEKLQEARLALAPALWAEQRESRANTPGDNSDSESVRGLTFAKHMEMIEAEKRGRRSSRGPRKAGNHHTGNGSESNYSASTSPDKRSQ